MVKIELSGGNEVVDYNSLEEAIKAAAEWYDYLAADGSALIGEDFPRLHTDGIPDVNELNQTISYWEEQLAKEIGFSPFVTQGGSYIRAADEVGFHLVAREIGIK